MNLNQTILDIDMVGWVLAALATGLLIAGLWYKPTRMVMAALLFLAGIAFNTTLYLAFIGIPLMLFAGLLLYSEYMQMSRPTPAAAGPMPSPTEGPAPTHTESQHRSPLDDDPGPADD